MSFSSHSKSLMIQILVVVLIFFGGYRLASYWIENKPQPRKMPPVVEQIQIEVQRLKPQAYELYIESQGIISSATQAVLSSEVSGKVIRMSPHFKNGALVEQGECLLELDSQDYEAAVATAFAALASAQLAFQEEQVRAQQALENWKLLHPRSAPTPLAKHEPQLQKLQADQDAAQAKLLQARRNVERTRICAPFRGHLSEVNTQLGQQVMVGAALASLIDSQHLEVRLPLTLNENAMLGTSPNSGAQVVRFSAPYQSQLSSLEGRLVRREAKVDLASQQVIHIAELVYPSNLAPLPIGSFVQARIQARTFEKVYRLPRSSVRAGDEILWVIENKIKRHKIKPLWSNADDVILAVEELPENSLLCLTPLSYATESLRVNYTEPAP
jgi:RND family efflux transporter MFP subunit